jgi:2-polyprenyl-3-methyl-5-hydroxy-6-metoxy-1,4-benzoquinol methylase
LLELNQELARDTGDWPRFASCPVCESADIGRFAVIRRMAHDRCRRCGFTFTNPYPPSAVLGSFYESDFYTNYRRVEDLRRNGDPYFSASMYTDMRALAGLAASCSPTSVLDYGCGTGSFLGLLRDEFGIDGVEGLEISREARERAREAYGLQVAGSTESLRQDAYDLVLLLEVIEHVPDPGRFFADVARLVRPGGSILITTPAVDNLIGRYLPQLSLHYTAPSHVSLFTTKAIRALLDRFSFTPVHFATDPAQGAARAVALSAFYTLDFASPQRAGDSDALIRPTAVGRVVGRSEHRGAAGPGRVLSGVLTPADRLIERLAPRPNHFYVVAQRRR